MKSFINATEAKSRTYQSLDNAIKDEFDKVHDQIVDSVNAGNFSTLWNVSESLATKHVSRIIELLTSNDFVIYNGNNRCVSLREEESFENFKAFHVKWDISVEEAELQERRIRYNDSYQRKMLAL